MKEQQKEILQRPVEDTRELTQEEQQFSELQQLSEGKVLGESLLTSKRTFGDSKLMKELKGNLKAVEDALDTVWADDLSEEKLSEIEQAYFKAIDSCDRYCAERHSTHSTGMARRELVEKNRTRLIREVELLEQAKELLSTKKITRPILMGAPQMQDAAGDADALKATIRDIFVRVKLYDFASAPEEKTASIKEKTSQTRDKELLEVLRAFRPSDTPMADEAAVAAYAAEIVTLRHELQDIPEGKVYATYVKIQGHRVLIRQDEDGTITISNGASSVVMTESAQELIAQLDIKVIEEQDRMDPEVVKEVIDEQIVYTTIELKMDDSSMETMKVSQRRSRDLGEIQGVNSRLSRYLELKTGKAAVYFSNFDTVVLRQLAIAASNGYDLTPTLKKLDAIEQEKRGKFVNTHETMELLEQARARQKEMAQKVIYDPSADKSAVDMKGWTKEEMAVRDFISELIFSQHTWEADETVAAPGERMLRMLKSNTAALAAMVADSYREDQTSPPILDKVLASIPFLASKKKDSDDADGDDADGEESFDIKQSITDAIKKIRTVVDAAADREADETIKEHVPEFTEVFAEEEEYNSSQARLKALTGKAEDGEELSDEEIEEMSLLADRMEELQDKKTAFDTNRAAFELVRALAIQAAQPEIEKQKLEAKRNALLIQAKLDEALSSSGVPAGFSMKELADMEKSIDDMVVDASDQLQTMITDCVKKVFSADKDKKVDPFAGLKDPEQKGIDDEEKAKRVKAGNDALAKIIEDSMQGESGQGKFIKLIFEHYFSGVSTMDKRCMFAAAVRNASKQKPLPPEPVPPAQLPADATEAQKAAYEAQKKTYDDAKKVYDDLVAEQMGELLGGILKGAGPLFQKILQGMPTESMPDSMKAALGDVKSKLAPIPDEIVKAQLLGMVERSNGRITKIEVERPLGAASVGQTFFCKMYGPGLPADGKDVVVKLLKPDVRNRMMREKEVMLKCARMTDADGGMEATYLGQLSRIEEELDLTIEARNVGKGEIYDKSTNKDGTFDGVRSMKLVEGVGATTNSMLLEKAPGDTVDRYTDKVKTKVAAFVAAKAKRAGESDQDYAVRLQLLRVDILSFLKEVDLRQTYLSTLCKKWVTEGVFGEGFYHGDLHAGNIMIDDSGATIIDYGNATSLNEQQRIDVTRMMAAAAAGDAGGFLSGLYDLLTPKFQAKFKKNSSAIEKDMKKIFSLGDQKSAGQRIGVALLKLQEKGIEVPSAIFNFSQCQLRLQNAVDGMGEQVIEMVKTLQFIDGVGIDTDTDPVDLPAIYLSDMRYDRKNKESKGASLVRYYKRLHELHSALDVEMIDDYDEVLMNPEKEALKKQVDRLRDRNMGRRLDDLSIQINTVAVNLANNTPGIEINDFVNNIVKKELNKTFAGFVQVDEVCRTISAYFKAIKAEAQKKDSDPKVLERLGGTIEQPPEWLGRIEAYLKTKADEVAAMISTADVLFAVRADATKKEDEKVAAREAFKSAYKKVSLSLLANGLYAPANRASTREEQRMGAVANALDSTKDVTKFEATIRRIATYDQELGPQLIAAYFAYFDYRRTDYDGPSDALLDRARQIDADTSLSNEEKDRQGKELLDKRAELRAQRKFEVTVLRENVLKLLTRIAARKVAISANGAESVCDHETKQFVDVMADTIDANLETSMMRLGFFTSARYRRVLVFEDTESKAL